MKSENCLFLNDDFLINENIISSSRKKANEN